jgi:hypothetical protein
MRSPRHLRKYVHSQVQADLRGVSETSWTVIVVTVSVKDDEKGGQGHNCGSLLHQSST